MDTTGVIQLAVVAVLLAVSAFFSSAETALTAVNRVKIRSLCEEGNKRAVILQKVLDNHPKMMTTILIGNNIVNIAASSVVTLWATTAFGSRSVGIATGILTLALLLFGEISPKNAALLYAENLALAYARIIFFLMKLLTPVIFVVNKLSRGLMILLHIDPAKKLNQITETELKTYVDASHEDGVIETEEKEMIFNVFDFSDAVAKDIMIPRIDMTTVDCNAAYGELMQIFRDSMYTRIPVYQDETDNIIGLVNVKDFILVENHETFRISDILRDAYYTYEYKKIADLLVEMRQETVNMAFVLNEYASCVGMITLEDLLEEIVGEIRDEYDADEDELIQEVADHTYLVEGSMKLDDINDALGTRLESEDYDSIGGIIIQILDRMPHLHDEVLTPDGIRLKVQALSQNRITKVLLTLPGPEEYAPNNTGTGRQEPDKEDASNPTDEEGITDGAAAEENR